jgi:hypothetical protein
LAFSIVLLFIAGSCVFLLKQLAVLNQSGIDLADNWRHSRCTLSEMAFTMSRTRSLDLQRFLK